MHKQTPLPEKLAKPAFRALANAGIQSLEQLALLRKEDFSSMHGIGKKTIEQVMLAFKNAGLRFRNQDQ